MAVIDEFLDEDLRQRLLDWAIGRRQSFESATVFHDESQVVDRQKRANLKFGDLGPLKEEISKRLLDALPQVASALGTKPPASPSLEMELTAYGDGGFYAAHRDIATGRPKTDGRKAAAQRVISAVLYFHRSPKAFEGGELRIYPWVSDENFCAETGARDIDTRDNRLVGFLSWARHEVRPVSCPSGRFENSRFALNCWYCEAPAS